MKNVLFATTAFVAMAGMASAAGHGGVSFSGAMTAGYNDVIEGGFFWSADLDMEASVDLGDNVTATATVQLFDWDFDNASTDADITVEIAYTGDPLSASIKAGDMGDEGASEYFYADRSGMSVDVENHDGDDEVRAMVGYGAFGFTFGCDMDGDDSCTADGFNYGAGATFGSIELGIGYDDGDNAGGEIFAVSADSSFGQFNVGVSYASVTGGENSMGVEVSSDISDMLTVGAYYASNSVADDAYGVSADYASGPLTVGVFFDHTNTGVDEFGADVSYAVNDQLTANAGIFNDGASVFYVGMDYMVNDNVTATLSWADADEIGGPEYKDGISAYITATF